MFIDDLFNVTLADTLPLVIKNYDIPGQSTFSNFLHKSEIGTEGFTIEGPFVTIFSS